MISERASELSGKALVNNRKKMFERDHAFRERHTDFDTYLSYYEGEGDKHRWGTNVDTTEAEVDEDGMPRINLVQRSVDETVYFVTRNIPKAELRADRSHINDAADFLERELRLKAVEDAEETMNALTRTILQENHYPDKVELAIQDAGIFGIGYLVTSLDNSVDVRNSYRLRGILEKIEKGERLSQADARQYTQLSARPSIDYIDARKVFLQSGVERAESDRMLRCSTVEYFSTDALRQRYQGIDEDPELGEVENITPGAGFHFMETPEIAESDRHDITGVLTTWEIEPFVVNNGVGKFLSARMVKTVIAGNVLVEKEMWTATEGPIRLPIVPFVFRQSKRHPYGRSEAKGLYQSERLINRVRALMYKSGLQAVRPNGVSIFVKNLGPGDREELENSFLTGEPAFITGNMVGQEISDVRQIVMPHTFASSPLDPALRQMYQTEMQAFQMNSNQGSQEAVGEARTGSAKRAQIAFNDRPKSLSVMSVTRSVERLYDSVYEMIRTTYTEEMSVSVSGRRGREQRTINEQFRTVLPVLTEDRRPMFDPQLQDPQTNPNGLVTRPVEMELNSTQIDMYAQAEGRGGMPHDITTRHQIIRGLYGDGLIVEETARDYILDDDMKITDDVNRQKLQREQQNRVQQMLSQLQGIDGLPQVPGASSAESPLPQDIISDIQDSLREQNTQ